MAKSSNVPRVGIVIAITITVAFLYVWQRIQIFRLGYKIRNTEEELQKLEEENTVLQLKISSLVNPQNIKKEIKRLGLGLRPPEEKQIVRIR